MRCLALLNSSLFTLTLDIRLLICEDQVSPLSIVTPRNLVLVTVGNGFSAVCILISLFICSGQRFIVTVFVVFSVSKFALNHDCKLSKSC